MNTVGAIMEVQAACDATLVGRLWFIGLAGRYRFLCAYLALESILSCALATITITSHLYEYIYVSVSPILCVLAYMVVLELCWLILEDYPGIAAVGKLIVSWSMGAAVLIAVIFAGYGMLAGVGSKPLAHSYAIIQLSVRIGLLYFLLVILYFVFKFHLRLPRNRMAYGIGFTLCWVASLITDALAMSARHEVRVVLNIAAMLFCVFLTILGCLVLTPKGERRVATEEPDSDEQRASLRRRLTEMNRLLSGIGNRGKAEE